MAVEKDDKLVSVGGLSHYHEELKKWIDNNKLWIGAAADYDATKIEDSAVVVITTDSETVKKGTYIKTDTGLITSVKNASFLADMEILNLENQRYLMFDNKELVYKGELDSAIKHSGITTDDDISYEELEE